MRMGRWVFVLPSLAPRTLISRITAWSQTARKEGLLALEDQMTEEGDSFMRKGLQLLVDGVEPERLREVLEVEIGAFEETMKAAARIWESAGGYAPTIGILGAVMGLINVMASPSRSSPPSMASAPPTLSICRSRRSSWPMSHASWH